MLKQNILNYLKQKLNQLYQQHYYLNFNISYFRIKPYTTVCMLKLDRKQIDKLVKLFYSDSFYLTTHLQYCSCNHHKCTAGRYLLSPKPVVCMSTFMCILSIALQCWEEQNQLTQGLNMERNLWKSGIKRFYQQFCNCSCKKKLNYRSVKHYLSSMKVL